ncbi:uncharacterized protein LOC135135157 [Zophobas morio]|uniref:uncharacterized protein LOC135135157 n=1 Tax=Zophobas morio TaxID=2755281 RepID=UPI003083D727
MALLLILFALAFSSFIAYCKVYDRCELALELKNVHKFPDDQLATWVCIAKHESTFNTSAVNQGSGDHGLFQISDLYWCSPPGNGHACNAPCSAFEDDDITDDIACIRRIFREHSILSGNGFNAWVVYSLYCKHDVSKYVEGCFDNEIYGSQTTTSTTAEPEDEDDVYEFPPLPTPPKKTKIQKEPFKAVVSSTGRPKTVSAQYQEASKLSTYSKYSSVTTIRPTAKPFVTLKPTKEAKVLRNYKQKPFSTFKEDLFLKNNNRLSTLRPPVKFSDSTRLRSTAKPYSFTTKLNGFRGSTTLKPLSFIYENIHSDRKREQNIVGKETAQYSFLWTANGFRMVKN